MSELSIITNSDLPATVESLVEDLKRLGVSEGSLILVHSSLSSLGWVSGGEVAVVEALQQAVGSRGTIVMPSYSTQLSEPAHWENPPVPESWWPIIRETIPAYDPDTTPTRGMGAISEYFRRLPGTVRGTHPQLSFAARGPLADEIVHPHALESWLDKSSPLGRIYAHDGSVLLLGVDHDRNTSLHLAEHKFFSESASRIRNGSSLMIDGQRQWVEFDEPDIPEADFCEIGRSFRLSNDGAVTVGKVALAGAQLMSQRKLVDFATRWFEAS